MRWARLAIWRHWSVRARLLALTALPLAYMFCTFVWYAHASRLAEVREELAERGPLVARVLAGASEFGLLSHRYDELKQTAAGLLQSDPSIVRIELLDAQRRQLINLAKAGPAQQALRYHEAPVLKRLLWVSMLAADGKPYLKSQPAGASVETMGYVRVTMSPSALLLRQARRFDVELLVACVGLAACMLLGWRMSVGFDATLQASMRALREADHDKRRLIGKIHTAVEEERKSIALEIHDELNATLVAVRLEAQRIASLSAVPGDDAARTEIHDRASSITRLALALYNNGRSLVRRLRPEVLDMLGLDGAVEEMVRHVAGAHRDCQFDFSADGEFLTLESGIGISAYRVIQEALSNIVKHARATHVTLRLSRKGGVLRIHVADNGMGFDAALASSGIGLVGMRERVLAYQGNIDIATGLALGTRLDIRLPG